MPDATNATSARKRNYDGESAEVLRQVLDDPVRTADGTAAPRFEPTVRTATGFIETVLDGAPVVNRTADGACVVAAERASLPLPTMPRCLTEPRVVTIRARVAGSGQVERLALTYEATYDGRPVRVEQNVVWGAAGSRRRAAAVGRLHAHGDRRRLTGPQDAIAGIVDGYEVDGVTPEPRRLGGDEDGSRPFDEMTDRQREIVETAYEAIYYEVLREATATKVPAELDLDASTVVEHLQRAERNLMAHHLEGA